MGVFSIRRGGQYGGQAVLKTVAGETVAGSNPVPSARKENYNVQVHSKNSV